MPPPISALLPETVIAPERLVLFIYIPPPLPEAVLPEICVLPANWVFCKYKPAPLTALFPDIVNRVPSTFVIVVP